MTEKNSIIVENISKVYPLYQNPQDRVKEIFSFKKKKYHEDFVALSDISFIVHEGETLGIIGKNGAGKSTLLKIITGVTTPTTGSIEMQGSVAALLELGTGFNPEYTGYENIYLNGTMRGYTREQMDEKIDGIIAFADIGEYINQPVKTYSSGMFARLAFSVMVSFKPDILIVDEALSVGDVFFQQKCNTFMKEKMKNVTKILVTHDMNSIANMADRVILLDKGKIIKEGKPLDVIEHYLKIMHTEIYLDNTENKIAVDEMKDITNGIDNWFSISSDETGGALEVVIEKFLFTVNGTIGDVVKYGDKIKIQLLLKSKKNCENIIWGYTFKDKYGNSIFAQNTLGAGIRIEGIKKNRAYLLQLSFPWPQVKEGDYFLTLGIGEGEDQMVHTIQCWAHNVAHVQGIASIPMHGIFNHVIENFSIEERN